MKPLPFAVMAVLLLSLCTLALGGEPTADERAKGVVSVGVVGGKEVVYFRNGTYSYRSEFVKYSAPCAPGR